MQFNHQAVPAAALTLLLAACAGTQQAAVPDAIKAGNHEALAMVVPAKGVQIYECRSAKSGAAAYEWAFVAPDAALLDARGNTIGRHGAGPYWEAADGSRVVGAVKARADAPTPDAIPWLLLATRTEGPAGTFSKVTSIQRVNTAGGTAPAAGCAAETVGAVARAPYTAEYIFFSTR